MRRSTAGSVTLSIMHVVKLIPVEKKGVCRQAVEDGDGYGLPTIRFASQDILDVDVTF